MAVRSLVACTQQVDGALRWFHHCCLAVIICSPDQVLRRGLRLAGTSSREIERQKHETNLEDFKAWCGSEAAVTAQVWEDLQLTTAAFVDKHGQVQSARINTRKRRSVHLKNFLRCHQFLKQHQTEKQRKLPFGNAEKTIRKWCWHFVERMAALKADKVSAHASFIGVSFHFLNRSSSALLDCLAGR